MKQLDNLPPSGIDDDDHGDEYESLHNDPFRERAHHRVVGNFFWFIDAARFWIGWPFVSLAHICGFLFASLGFRLSQIMHRLERMWAKFWFNTIEFLQVEGMRRSVSEMQQRAAQSVDDIRHTVGDKTVGSSWWRNLMHRVDGRRAALVMGWYSLLDRARESPILGILTAPLRLGTRLSFAVSDFAMGWFWTRDYRHLLFGIPAMLMMLPLGYCAVRLPFHTDATKIKHYRRAADTALADDNFEAASLYFRKLRQLGGEHEQMIFRAALAKSEQEDNEAAYAEMQRIAPLDQPGMLEAHLWIAEAISSQRITVAPDEAVATIEQHLRHALELKPDNSAIIFWLSELLTSQERIDDAQTAIEDIKPRDLSWDLRAALADLYLKMGQPQQARDTAIPVARHFQSQHDDAVDSVTTQDYLSWAAAVEIGGDLAGAIDILVKGTEQYPDDGPIRKTTFDVALSYFDQISPDTSVDLERKLRMLNLLDKISPDRVTVLDRAVRLYTLPGARRTVAGILKNYRDEHGTYPPPILRLLGDVSYTNDKTDAARKYYAAAVKADTTQHAAANNLAVLCSTIEPIQLAVALKLANGAVEQVPDNPHYLETRGQIFIKLKRWNKAVADLRRALNGMPYKREIHASLADAYAALGQDEPARMHRQQAQ